MARILINQDHLKLKQAFIKGLRNEYHVKHRDLWECFLIYKGFLKQIGCEYLIEATEWQLEDYRRAITGYKTMWHRSRRAGKSMGLTLLAVFFSIIKFGYRSNAGKVIWRAPQGNQLNQAADWFKKNPFVMYVQMRDGYIKILDSEDIDIKSMTEGNVASLGGSVYIIDEAKKIYKGLKIYNEALESYGMFAEGDLKYKRMISASTGARLTLFHEQYLSNEWDYSIHPWNDCYWISKEFIESERRGNPQDPYYVQQEYECIWVARGDTAFRNIYIVDMVEKTIEHDGDTYHFGDHPFFPLNWTFPTPRKAGVDFNDAAGHYIVIGSMDDQAIYINQEFVVSTVNELKPYADKYDMEIESGPFEINIQNALKCSVAGIKCIHMNWDKDIIAERFRILMDKMIIIDRHKCSFTLSNLLEAVFDENSRESKLKKTSKQHGLDAAMHMIHKTPMQPVIYKRPVYDMHNNDFVGSNIF